jgi:NAD(P)-dependent dehydrogenase (short-subunit alcohol dehydrogenase family)
LFEQALIEPTASYNLSQNATYLIAGGLGGQGRSIIRWMVSRGARHFLVLSRQGAVSEEAKAFVQEMVAEGINIQTPACDISNRLSLVEVLRAAKATMPAIKGCIQAAMALKVRINHPLLIIFLLLTAYRTHFSPT